LAKPLSFYYDGVDHGEGFQTLGAFENAEGLLLVLTTPQHDMAAEAAQCVLERVGQTFDEMPMDDPKRFLTKLVSDANSALFALGQTLNPPATIEASIACLFFSTGYVSYSHIGNARMYLLSDGIIKSATQDHTQAQQMVDSALLKPEEARKHPFSLNLLRAIGRRPIIEVPVHRSIPVKNGDHYILCSPGISRRLDDQSIGLLVVGGDIDAACQSIRHEAALAEGDSRDILSLQAIRFGDELPSSKVKAYNPLDNITRSLMRKNTTMEGKSESPSRDLLIRAGIAAFLFAYMLLFAICNPDCSGAQAANLAPSHVMAAPLNAEAAVESKVVLDAEDAS